MPSRNPDLPLDQEIEYTEQQLHILHAIWLAVSDPHTILELIAGSEDADTARRDLSLNFGLDDVQASAVLDAQYRRATKSDRAALLDRVQRVSAQLEYLRTLEQ